MLAAYLSSRRVSTPNFIPSTSFLFGSMNASTFDIDSARGPPIIGWIDINLQAALYKRQSLETIPPSIKRAIYMDLVLWQGDWYRYIGSASGKQVSFERALAQHKNPAYRAKDPFKALYIYMNKLGAPRSLFGLSYLPFSPFYPFPGSDAMALLNGIQVKVLRLVPSSSSRSCIELLSTLFTIAIAAFNPCQRSLSAP